MHVQAMRNTHPRAHGAAKKSSIQATEACFDCAQACIACADACLAEDMVKDLRECIRMNLDCTDVCYAAGALGTRQTGSNESIAGMMFALCAEVCSRCGEECARHSDHHEHCRICAGVCRTCEQACRDATRGLNVH